MKQNFEVTARVAVTVDESKFTPEFMEEFRRDFYQFHTVQDHMRSLASRYVHGICDECSEFIEGYGDPADFGIKFEFDNSSVENC